MKDFYDILYKVRSRKKLDRHTASLKTAYFSVPGTVAGAESPARLDSYSLTTALQKYILDKRRHDA